MQRYHWARRGDINSFFSLMLDNLAVMIIRYVVRMGLYPHERWTGGSIPIFFHWVLSLYVLVVGYHHWRQTRSGRSANHPSVRRRWIADGLRLAGWSVFRQKAEKLTWGDALFDPSQRSGLGILLNDVLARPEHRATAFIEGWLSTRPAWWDETLVELVVGGAGTEIDQPARQRTTLAQRRDPEQ